MAQKNVTGPMDGAEAQAITDRIRGHIDAAWADITRAYEGKAWKALGYTSWEGYVKAEFDMSRRRSYQLLDQGRVIGAIAEAAGESVQRVAQISARDVVAVKDDLPAVTGEIKQRVDAGENPETAVKETLASARDAKAKAKAERAARQAEDDALREQHVAALPDVIKQREQAKADAIAARKSAPADAGAQIVELERLNSELNDKVEEQAEAIKALETEVTALRADNKLYGEMKVQFEQGGYDKVVAGKDEEIRVLQSRLYQESAEKVRNLRERDRYLRILKDQYNHFKDAVIDPETGEITYV